MKQKTNTHDVIRLAESLNLKHIDKRNSGGAFWVIGGRELAPAIQNLNAWGYYFQFKDGGGKSSDYEDAWWYKPSSHEVQVSPENNDMQTTVIEILNQRFPNGIRPNSVIDLNKLKKFYFEVAGECISEEVSDISSMLEEIGIGHGDKVYAFSEDSKQELTDLITRLQAEGNRIFYYDELYDTHAETLQRMNIFSSDLLKTILSEVCPSLRYHSKHCKTDSTCTVESEVLRCFKTAISLSYDQFQKRLPYIPIPKIRHVLVCDRDFIHVTIGVYTHISKIEYDKAECGKVCSQVKADISNNGFASLASVNCPESLALNPELSEAAIKSGFFRVFLSDRFERQGNIITEKGGALNSANVLERFCRSNASLTLDELCDCEKAITGYITNKSLFAAYKSMIRINRDTFVSDSEIQFDVAATDCALDRFVLGDVIPLQGVTSFISFPYINGFPWNPFMLESYCRRFSEHFAFQCLTVNSLNIGAIYRKTAKFANYAEVLAAAVASESIELSPKEVGDYLFGRGYIARRTNFVADVVEQAHRVREGIF
ncbi:MAG: hypothetical protein ABIL62_06305 [Planctomycetota bacterium]